MRSEEKRQAGGTALFSSLLTPHSSLLTPHYEEAVPKGSETPPVGLLAGSGRFPIAFAAKARDVGLPVVCVALGGIAADELRPWSTAFTGRTPPASAG